MKRLGLVVFASLVAASCGSGVAEPLLPEGQGWVIDHEQSPDLVYDWDRSAITSGLVEVVLVDGTSAMINAKTDLVGLCQELAPPPAVAHPCWLQVGPATADGHADWVMALGLRGDTGQPQTWNQNHASYQAAEAQGGRITDVNDRWIVFDSGHVVARGPAEPVFSGLCPVSSLSELVAIDYDTPVHFHPFLDIDEGFVTTFECYLRD